MRNCINILSGVIIALLFSCAPKQEDNNDSGQISADVVKNPISANALDTTGKKLPKISFTEEAFDFGKIKQGEKVSHIFKFKNIGQSDLIISSASSSCGCTVPEYPKNPIKPGAEGQINVVFNTEGKSGIQHKTVTVVLNSIPNTKIVTVSADVITQ